MIQQSFATRIGLILALLAGASTCPSVRAQEVKPEPLTFAELTRRNVCELEQIYRQAKCGNIPVGFARGRIVLCPNEPFAAAKSRTAELLWQGKHFCADGSLINQWLGVRAIRAKVDYGPSWIDGGNSIIMDYQGTSRVWNDVRDEMREVAPGLYLGAMYRRGYPQPKFKLFFVLQIESCESRP